MEDPLAEREITVSYETIRQWCRKFGTDYAWKLRRRQGRLGDTWHLDELFVTIQGQRQYLWLKRNDFGLTTESSRISSESEATCHGQSTTASYDLAPSLSGKR